MVLFRGTRERRTVLRLTRDAARAAAPAVSAARAEVDQLAATVRDGQRAAQEARPTCPKCGARLVVRTAHRKPWDGAQFWGCSNYPRCRHIAQLSEFPDAAIPAPYRARPRWR
jgi:restriction system protein